MRIDTNRILSKNEQIIVKEIDGACALIDPYRRARVSLNPTALEVWQLIDGSRSVAAIIEILKNDFEVDAKKLEHDVLGFFKDLIKREMVQ